MAYTPVRQRIGMAPKVVILLLLQLQLVEGVWLRRSGQEHTVVLRDTPVGASAQAASSKAAGEAKNAQVEAEAAETEAKNAAELAEKESIAAAEAASQEAAAEEVKKTKAATDAAVKTGKAELSANVETNIERIKEAETEGKASIHVAAEDAANQEVDSTKAVLKDAVAGSKAKAKEEVLKAKKAQDEAAAAAIADTKGKVDGMAKTSQDQSEAASARAEATAEKAVATAQRRINDVVAKEIKEAPLEAAAQVTADSTVVADKTVEESVKRESEKIHVSRIKVADTATEQSKRIVDTEQQLDTDLNNVVKKASVAASEAQAKVDGSQMEAAEAQKDVAKAAQEVATEYIRKLEQLSKQVSADILNTTHQVTLDTIAKFEEDAVHNATGKVDDITKLYDRLQLASDFAAGEAAKANQSAHQYRDEVRNNKGVIIEQGKGFVKHLEENRRKFVNMRNIVKSATEHSISTLKGLDTVMDTYQRQDMQARLASQGSHEAREDAKAAAIDAAKAQYAADKVMSTADTNKVKIDKLMKEAEASAQTAAAASASAEGAKAIANGA
mmetsp:Transcript_37618/g.79651  ORF Transcript_37618/g.79651 Transcript_37618/m.79651 type:complete len:558 (+) Transcript_37618:54-1727(+)